MNGAPPRPRRPSDRAFGFALFWVALLPRLYVAVAWIKEPVWDGHYYHFGAERIAAGLGYSEDVWVRGQLIWKPWVHYPVGYSALLGALYRTFGSSLLVAPLLNALLGALLAVTTFHGARDFLGQRRAALAAALVALHPGLIAYTPLVMTEVLAAFLISALGLSLLSRRRWAVPVAGVLLGALVLVRPASLALLALLPFLRHGGVWTRIRDSVLVVLLAGLCVMPWTVRNCQRLDGCALVSTNGGWNLAIGAITESGRFQTLRASDGCSAVRGQVHQDRCWAELGKRRILADPMGFLRRVPRKLAETFNHESFAFEYLHEADPIRWSEARRVAGRELTSWYHRLLLLIAGFGVVALPREFRRDRWGFAVQCALLLTFGVLSGRALMFDDKPFFWLPVFAAVVGLLPLPGRPATGPGALYAAGVLLSVVLVHALFFGEDRYHMVASPMLCVLAAAALRPSRGHLRSSATTWSAPENRLLNTVPGSSGVNDIYPAKLLR
ncbi:MAG TPA: hypothetical protein VFQ61_28060 [Polyangiaceae bacterium]|nr:hypothetical protein [Polyangiaceae bacterium]